jgi:hypothetical protein
MLGMAPAVFAAAKFLPKAKSQVTYPTTQTVKFTGTARFKPGDLVTISGCNWAGTYRCVSNEPDLFEKA